MLEKRNQKNGFSLVELIVALGVVSIMSGVGVSMVVQNLERGRIATAREDIRAIMQAVESFHANITYHPAYFEGTVTTLLSGPVNTGTADGLGTYLLQDPSQNTPPNEPRYLNWQGPYLSDDRVDPWGNAYSLYVDVFRCSQVSTLSPNADSHGWILSGGSDDTIQTLSTNATLQDDTDVGRLLYSSDCP